MTTDWSNHPDDQIYGTGKRETYQVDTFNCPACGSHLSRLLRKDSVSGCVIRGRECECGRKYHTVERVETA